MKQIYTKIYLMALVSGISWAVQAQNCPARPANMVAGGFMTTPPVACVGMPVTVRNTSMATNVKYTYNLVNLADTAKGIVATTTTYGSAGRYLIVQTGRIGNQRSYACQAITVNNTPAFTFTATPCTGNLTVRLTINNLTALPYNAYQITWGDGSAVQTWTPTQPAPIHTYPRTMPAMIQVTGIFVGSTCAGRSTNQTITVTGTAPQIPTWVSADVIDPTTVELVYQTPQSSAVNNYVLQQRVFPSQNGTNVTNPNFTALGMNNQVRARVTGVQTTNNTYMYVLNQTSACGGTNVSISSQDIGIVSLAVATQQYQNVLSWRPFTSSGLANFQVLRDGEVIGTLSATTFNYTDQKVMCGQKYTYQVVAIYNRTPAARSSSVKTQVTTMPIALPPALPNVSVNVRSDTQNQLVIVPPSTNTRVMKEYWVRTSDNRDIRGTRAIINDTLGQTSTGSICYTTTYFDICDRRPKDSVVVCSIFLEARGESLLWSDKSPIGGGTGTTALRTSGYTVERLDNQGRVLRTYNVSLNTEWNMDPTDTNQEVIYRIRARASAGTTTAVSNIVKAYRSMKVFVPDAFSPNGDRANETLAIKGSFIKEARFTITNRTGQPLAQPDWKKGWDGLIDGQPAASGWYGYVVEATDTKGLVETVRGLVLLIR